MKHCRSSSVSSHSAVGEKVRARCCEPVEVRQLWRFRYPARLRLHIRDAWLGAWGGYLEEAQTLRDSIVIRQRSRGLCILRAAGFREPLLPVRLHGKHGQRNITLETVSRGRRTRRRRIDDVDAVGLIDVSEGVAYRWKVFGAAE